MKFNYRVATTTVELKMSAITLRKFSLDGETLVVPFGIAWAIDAKLVSVTTTLGVHAQESK